MDEDQHPHERQEDTAMIDDHTATLVPRTRALLRPLRLSHVLLACSVLWIALGSGRGVAAGAAGQSSTAVVARCPNTTPRSIPLEALTIAAATDIAPIAGVGHAVRYRHKTLTSGLQLTGVSASGTFLLNHHYRHLVGVVYVDDASPSPGGILIRDLATDNVVDQYHFIGAHDRVPLNIDVQSFTSIAVQIIASDPPATVDVVARLTQ